MTATALKTRQLFEEFVVPNYARYDVVLVRGQGSRVWDADGKEYLDFGAGIAVSTLGHAHPRIIEALERRDTELAERLTRQHALDLAEHVAKHCDFLS